MNPSNQTGLLINTQPAPQQLPDPNAASLVTPQQQGSMSPDQSFAALGFATHVSNQALMAEHGVQSGEQTKQSEDNSTSPQNVPGDTESPKEDKKESGMEERLMKQIDDLKSQITNNHQSDEISRIRQELTDLLKEDGQEK